MHLWLFFVRFGCCTRDDGSTTYVVRFLALTLTVEKRGWYCKDNLVKVTNMTEV